MSSSVASDQDPSYVNVTELKQKSSNNQNQMADSTNLKSMIESETSKNNVAPVERRKNVGNATRRKLTPHPLNPTPNESTSEVQPVNKLTILDEDEECTSGNASNDSSK